MKKQKGNIGELTKQKLQQAQSSQKLNNNIAAAQTAMQKNKQKSQREKQSICIIGVSEKKQTDMILLEGAKKNFQTVLFVPISSLRMITESGKILVKYRDIDISKFDCILMRVPESKYETANIILQNIKNIFDIQNSESFLTASNRLLLFQELAKAGINVPKICFADTAESASRSFSELRFPILVRVPIAKERIMLAKNAKEAKAMMDTLEALKQPIFLEEYYTDVDLLQVFVVGGKVFGSLKRKAVDIGYKKGKVIPARVSGRIKRIATHACRAIGTQIARVDILNTPHPVVVDVSICPLLGNLQKVSNEDIGKKIFERISYLIRVKKGGLITRLVEDVRLALEDILSV